MVTLVIPDIHHKWKLVKKIEDRHPDVDEIVYLGDYLDDFHDTPEMAATTAKELRNRLNDKSGPKRTMLLGNHDVPYWNSHPAMWCPGWTKQKHAAVKDVMRPQDWEKTSFFYQSQGWLFSHAGFDERHQHPVLGLDFTMIGRGLKTAMENNLDHPLLAVGKDRGGNNKVGGINWIDIRSITPVPGYSQVVGHTPVFLPMFVYTSNKNNVLIGIDTHLASYGLIVDGDYFVHDTMGGSSTPLTKRTYSTP